MAKISEADLILNSDGSIYHLNLLPKHISDTIITVGDPSRVYMVSQFFDEVEFEMNKREFITHVGKYKGKKITVISTGIGTDNVEIFFNELDALVNVDFETREIKKDLTSLNIIRVGTSGAVQPDIPMGTILASSYGLGMDALMNYYLQQLSGDEQILMDDIKVHFGHLKNINPYLTAASETLLNTIGKDMAKGITITAPGFYAPQGRIVRAKNAVPDFIGLINSFKSNQYRITNLEMETAGIYALAKVLGHNAISVNAILASRVNFEFSKEPNKIVAQAIKMVLERI